MKQVFVKGCHLLTTALLTIDEIIALTVVESFIIRDKYVQFLELIIVCDLISVYLYLMFF